MQRSLTLSFLLLTAPAVAQCYTQSGASITSQLVPQFGQPVDDDGRTDPIALGFTFPLVGAPVTITHAQIDANGVLYLVDATGVVTPADFGISNKSEMRGVSAANRPSARVVAYGGDLMAGTGGTWDITLDTSVAGQFKVCWHDLSSYVWSGPTGSFRFSTTLFDDGSIEFAYGDAPFVGAGVQNYVGVSIGDNVGDISVQASDLSEGADSGSLGLLYQNAWSPFDLGVRALRFTPNGVGGFSTHLTCLAGSHASYGDGCYAYEEAHQAVYAHFLDAAASAAVLPGTSLAFTPSGDGYALTRGGAAYLAPTGAATQLAVYDDTEIDLTPSVPFPHVGGPVPVLSVCSNGYVNMGPTGLNDVDDYGSPFNLRTQNVASFRSNSDYDANFGAVWAEERVIGGSTVLLVTWVDVPRFFNGGPETFQFQLDLDTGAVVIAWHAMSTAGLHDLVVGYAPAGPSLDGGALDLDVDLPHVTSPDIVLEPLSLSASPAAVNDGVDDVVVTYTAEHMVEVAPGAGASLGLLLVSLTPTAGVPLDSLGLPGCQLHVASLDLVLTLGPSASSTASAQLDFGPSLGVPPGFSVYCQAVSLFDPSSPLPNGANAFGAVTSNGLRTRVGSY